MRQLAGVAVLAFVAGCGSPSPTALPGPRSSPSAEPAVPIPPPTAEPDPLPSSVPAPPTPIPTQALLPPQRSDCATWHQLGAPIVPEGPVAEEILFSHEGDLWRWRHGWAASERLTRDAAIQCEPRFLDNDTISFVVQDRLFEWNRSGGAPRPVTQAPGTIFTHAWNPDRTMVAVIAGTSLIDADLYVAGRAGESPRRIRGFGDDGGRCGGWGDETTVAWSPDGSAIAMVNTGLDGTEPYHTLYVVSPSGQDLIPSRRAEQARWLSASHLLAYEFGDESGAVVVLGLDGTREVLFETERPVDDVTIAAGGSMIAFTGYDAEYTPQVFVYDRSSASQRLVGTKMRAPVWLDEHVLLATVLRSPAEPSMEMWEPARRTLRIDLESGRTDDGPLQSTSDIDVRFTAAR